jgi:hypothetical protein
MTAMAVSQSMKDFSENRGGARMKLGSPSSSSGVGRLSVPSAIGAFAAAAPNSSAAVVGWVSVADVVVVGRAKTQNTGSGGGDGCLGVLPRDGPPAESANVGTDEGEDVVGLDVDADVVGSTRDGLEAKSAHVGTDEGVEGVGIDAGADVVGSTRNGPEAKSANVGTDKGAEVVGVELDDEEDAAVVGVSVGSDVAGAVGVEGQVGTDVGSYEVCSTAAGAEAASAAVEADRGAGLVVADVDADVGTDEVSFVKASSFSGGATLGKEEGAAVARPVVGRATVSGPATCSGPEGSPATCSGKE